MVQQVGHRVAGVGAGHNGGGVVRQQQDLVILVLFQSLFQNGQYPAVDHLNGFYFVFRFVAVAALVRRLKVHIHQIVARQQIQRRLGFALKVGVNITGGAGHFCHFHAGAVGNALEQVYGRDHTALDAVQRLKGLERRALALAPQPNAVGRATTGSHAGFVHRVVL